MSTVLVIKAHPHTPESLSLTVGEKFIAEYKKSHPSDKVIVRDLYKDGTPTLNSKMLMALRKKQHQKLLSAFEQKLLCEHDDWLNDFMLADKYLFVAPI